MLLKGSAFQAFLEFFKYLMSLEIYGCLKTGNFCYFYKKIFRGTGFSKYTHLFILKIKNGVILIIIMVSGYQFKKVNILKLKKGKSSDLMFKTKKTKAFNNDLQKIKTKFLVVFRFKYH